MQKENKKPDQLTRNWSEAQCIQAVNKEWKKLDTIPAWQLDKVKSKKEVTREAHKDKRKVHLTYVISKNAQLEPTFQKYKV